MRGRKPSATSLSVINGGKSIAGTVQEKAPSKPPKEPKWAVILGETEAAILAAAEWRRIIRPLTQLGVLAELDGRLLQDYCICCAQLDEANRDIAANGFSSAGERGMQKNAAVTAANQYRTQLRFYISELGLSPTARLRMALPEGDDKEHLHLD